MQGMTILCGLYDEDQMVPELGFDTELTVNTECGQLYQPIVEAEDLKSGYQTDLDTLLSDITDITQADAAQNHTEEQTTSVSEQTTFAVSTEASMDTANLRILDFQGAFLQDEVTFYDDPVPFIKKEKTMDMTYGVLEAEQRDEVQHQQPEVPYDADLDKVRREVEYACVLLDIPADPYCWSVPQVHKWIKWTLEQYQLPSCYADDFQMNGTDLCLMNEDAFKAQSPQVGQYLYGQLDFWRNAYSLSAMPSQATQYETELPVYTDLTTMNHHTQQQQQQQQQQTHQHLQQQQQARHQQHHMSPNCSGAYMMSAVPVNAVQSHGMLPMNMNPASPMNIPKPVFNAPIASPAPSLESLDSSSSYSPASSYTSEHDVTDNRTYEMPSVEPKHEMTPTKQNIHLWQFLRELLLQPRNYGNCIRWLDRSKGIFKIEDSARVARLWGMRKNRPAMNYDKLSRSIRQYYKKGIIKKTDNSKRLVYQFCPQYRV